jgi:hypothetical protein
VISGCTEGNSDNSDRGKSLSEVESLSMERSVAGSPS